jgi:hypothetical protein
MTPGPLMKATVDAATSWIHDDYRGFQLLHGSTDTASDASLSSNNGRNIK